MAADAAADGLPAWLPRCVANPLGSLLATLAYHGVMEKRRRLHCDYNDPDSTVL
jgi:hypothetical protein